MNDGGWIISIYFHHTSNNIFDFFGNILKSFLSKEVKSGICLRCLNRLPVPPITLPARDRIQCIEEVPPISSYRPNDFARRCACPEPLCSYEVHIMRRARLQTLVHGIPVLLSVGVGHKDGLLQSALEHRVFFKHGRHGGTIIEIVPGVISYSPLSQLVPRRRRYFGYGGCHCPSTYRGVDCTLVIAEVMLRG